MKTIAGNVLKVESITQADRISWLIESRYHEGSVDWLDHTGANVLLRFKPIPTTTSITLQSLRDDSTAIGAKVFVHRKFVLDSIEAIVSVNATGFEVWMGGSMQTFFPHRLPWETFDRIEFSHPRNYAVSQLTETQASDRLDSQAKQVLYWKSLSMTYTLVSDTCQGAVNFRSARGHILLHFNPRTKEGDIVLNVRKATKWARPEERLLLPPRYDQTHSRLTVTITVNATGFLIVYPVDSHHHVSYLFRHRMQQPNDYMLPQPQFQAQDWTVTIESSSHTGTPPVATSPFQLLTDAALMDNIVLTSGEVLRSWRILFTNQSSLTSIVTNDGSVMDVAQDSLNYHRDDSFLLLKCGDHNEYECLRINVHQDGKGFFLHSFTGSEPDNSLYLPYPRDRLVPATTEMLVSLTAEGFVFVFDHYPYHCAFHPYEPKFSTAISSYMMGNHRNLHRNSSEASTDWYVEELSSVFIEAVMTPVMHKKTTLHEQYGFGEKTLMDRCTIVSRRYTG